MFRGVRHEIPEVSEPPVHRQRIYSFRSPVKVVAMMQSRPETGGGTVKKDIRVSSPEWELSAQVPVPTGPTPLSEMLPLARALSDAIVSQTARVHEQAGEAVSCKK